VRKLTLFDIFHYNAQEEDNEAHARDTRVYPKVSGLTAWGENCK
jgi:hypothetical protein